MDANPLISVVTPSYNQDEFIEETLHSVNKQKYPKIEHIVVDGGSTDNTVEILKEYEKKYNIKWISEPDGGQSDAINKGFRMAQGDIIGWLNSDDLYLDKKVFSDVVKCFKINKQAEIIYGHTVHVDKNKRSLFFQPAFPWISYDRLLRDNYISQPSVFFAREVIKEHKLDIELSYSMDYEFWIRLAFVGRKFTYVNRFLSAFRHHSQSKTGKDRKEQLKENQEIRERYNNKKEIKNLFLKRLEKFPLYLSKIYMLKRIFKLYDRDREDLFIQCHLPLERAIFRTLIPTFNFNK